MAPIRAIVARFSFDFSHRSMEAVLKARPFEFAAIIAAGAEPRWFDAIPQSSQQWFDSGAIRGCTYEGVDWTALAPLDEELIENMRPCESLFMKTVTRLERKYEISYATRREWYLRHLRFWNDYLTRYRIDLFLSAWIPHELPDIIIYHLCRLRRIPVLYFHMSTERDMQFAEHDIEESAAQIGKRYEELLKEYEGVTDPAKIPLSAEADERILALTAPAGQKPALQSITYPTFRHHLAELLKRRLWAAFGYALRYFTPGGIRRAHGAWKRSRIIRERNVFYDAHAIDPDLTRPFIYLALHYQPEASTVPMGGAFADQVLIAQMLNATIPDGVLIYVKEHPRESSWLSRSVDYYKEFLAIPKVRLIARKVDTFVLREKCVAVATASGSVGFEAIFRGKPVFMFGHRFYQYCRGVFRIRTRADMEAAARAVFKDGKKPSLVECRLYYKAMEETCVKGSLNPWDYKVTKLPEEEHVKVNSEAIVKELDALHL